MSESRTIVITGGSAGIGAALATRLAADGAQLVLAARNAEALAGAVAAARDAGSPAALAVPTDVTRRADVEQLRDRALERFGAVDVWVNNAGRGISRPVLELTDDDVDEMIAVNVRSVLYGMQAIVPHFVGRDRGHLINVSSFLGRVPIATFRSMYSAAKAAVNSLTANLRMDLRARGSHVHVSTVLPGVVTTGFARNVLGEPVAPIASPPGAPGPAMRPQTADEIADAIAALIEQPRSELYTNPASPALARRYFDDVEAFEAQLRPPPAS